VESVMLGSGYTSVRAAYWAETDGDSKIKMLIVRNLNVLFSYYLLNEIISKVSSAKWIIPS
jgi:hypothetical protein